VLDASTNHAGAYATWLLSRLGAEVTVTEPPGGSPLRRDEAAWTFLRHGLTPVAAADTSRFDVVILSVDGDPDAVAAQAAAQRAANPAQVVAVVSPYGLDGPWAGYRAAPLLDWALGGHQSLNGEPDREPLPGGGPWLSALHGATAAVGIQAALRRVARTGTGDLLDVAALEALAAAHQWSIVIYSHQGIVKRRWGNLHGEAHFPLSFHPCADGWVCIASVSPHQWEGLCIAMDLVELLADDELYIPACRFDRAAELGALLDAWTSTHTTAEVVAALQ
jgi:crotonobetainyl-CoA:carnitine CoA-transferase CaiB-like acyl-CoA transferase